MVGSVQRASHIPDMSSDPPRLPKGGGDTRGESTANPGNSAAVFPDLHAAEQAPITEDKAAPAGELPDYVRIYKNIPVTPTPTPEQLDVAYATKKETPPRIIDEHA